MHRIYGFRRANGHTFASLDTWTGSHRPVITWLPSHAAPIMQVAVREAAAAFIREQRRNGVTITVTTYRQD